MKKTTHLLWSFIFPLSSILWGSFYHEGHREFNLGFPFKFITYHGLETPDSNILIFKHFFSLTSFRLDIYLVCVVITYYSLKLLFKLIKRITSPSS